MGGGGGREVGGGKEELIDRAQVLAVCACATSSPVWQAESHLQAHTARGRAISTQSPRAQPPAARARTHARAAGALPPSPGPQLQEAQLAKDGLGGVPNRSQTRRVGTAHASSSHKAATSPKTHTRHHWPESTCGNLAAHPHIHAQGAFCAPKLCESLSTRDT